MRSAVTRTFRSCARSCWPSASIRPDAFLLESPSTPLPHITATRSALLLYIDRDVYRLVPAARELLARRCAVLGDSEEEFFEGLERWLGHVRAGNEFSGGSVDDGFLENVCTGSGQPSSAARMVSFLRDIYVGHPLDDSKVITATPWMEASARTPANSNRVAEQYVLAIYGTGAIVPVYLEGLLGAGVAADRIVVVGRRLEAAQAVAANHGTHAAGDWRRRLASPRDRDYCGDAGCAPGPYAVARSTPERARSLSRSPGALSSSELNRLHDAVTAVGATAHVVFQRRFLPSATRCLDLIREDGGAVACYFEVTEIEQHVLLLRGQNGPQENFARWGLVNPISRA